MFHKRSSVETLKANMNKKPKRSNVFFLTFLHVYTVPVKAGNGNENNKHGVLIVPSLKNKTVYW